MSVRLGGGHGASILPTLPRGSSGDFSLLVRGFFRIVRTRMNVVRMSNTDARRGVVKLRANARRRVGIGEQNRAERDVARTARDQLECVLSRRHAAHADDRKLRRGEARVHRCKCDGLQRRTGKSTRRAREHRLQRARIERSSAQRVDRARDRRRPRRRLPSRPPRCPGVRRKAWRRAGLRSPRGRRRRSPPHSPPPRRRSGTRGSARSRRRRRVLRTCRRSPLRRSRRRRSRAVRRARADAAGGRRGNVRGRDSRVRSRSTFRARSPRSARARCPRAAAA